MDNKGTRLSIGKFTKDEVIMRLELTAKGYMCPGGQTIQPGDSFFVNVQLSGIHPSTVLANPKASESIRHQLSAQGLELPPHGYLSYGQWNVTQI